MRLEGGGGVMSLSWKSDGWVEDVGLFLQDYFPPRPWTEKEQKDYASLDERREALVVLREVAERSFRDSGRHNDEFDAL